jgi:hypothetical protein
MRLHCVFVLLIAACGPRPQQAVYSDPSAQQANMETLCQATVNAYCARCGIEQTACGQTYVECLGGHSPADASAFTMGQVDACSAAVNAGDCAVMPRVWPAACSTPTPTCSGGASWDGTQCVCPAGTAWDGTQCSVPAAATPATPAAPAAPTCSGNATWDGAQCVCPPGSSWDGTQCVCPAGAAWDGTQCVCPAGTGWNGSQCVGTAQPGQQPPRKQRASCRQALLDKGYGIDQIGVCKDLNDRCAVLLISHNYGVDQLGFCRQRSDLKCVEDLLNRGYGIDQLSSCRK